MIKPFEDFQKMGQQNLDATVRSFGEVNKGLQAIASEMSEYTKRSFKESSDAAQQVAAARSLEQAMEIQSQYVRSTYDSYMAEMSKLGNMYAEIARDAFRPIEKIVTDAR